MGLLDTVRRVSLARVTDRKSSDVTWDGDRGWSLVRGKDGDDLPRRFQDYVREGWRRNPVVRRCVTEYQTSVAEAPIHAWRMTEDGDFERIVGHPAEALFVRPNERDDGVGFIERAVQHYLLGGNVFLEKRRSGAGVPIELHAHRPDYVVAADVDKRSVPLRWEVVDDARTGATRFVAARDMIHVPDVDPLNEVFGMPRLASAVLETDTDNKASSYVNEVLGNFGTPGTLVMLDAEKVRNRAYLERAEDQWTEKFGPGRGRGKVAFLPGATRVQNVGFDLKELEFKALRSISREGICSVFGVDPMLVGLGSAARGGSSLSGAEHESARQAFWQQTILPMFRRWNAVLNAFMAPEYGENVWLMFDTSEVGALQPDRDADVKRAKEMAESGSYTREEIRAETGHDPELDEGNLIVLRGPIKYKEVGSEIAEPVDPDEEEPAGPGGEDDEGGAPNDDGDPAAEGAADEEEEEDEAASLTAALDAWEVKAGPAKRAVGSVGFGLTGHSVKSREDRGTVWKQFDDFARAQESAYRLQAEDMLRTQETEIRRLARVVLREDGKSAEVKGITPESLDEFRARLGEKFDGYHREWRRRYDDLMSQTVDVVAGRLSGATGLSFNVFNPLVRQAIDERLNLIVGADEKTFRAVMKVAEDGFVQGLSRDAMAERVAGVVREGVTVRLPSGKTRILGIAERAKLIATTETTAISNRAAVALMRTTTVPWVKTWLSQGDDRVRPEHQEEEADSEEAPVPLDEPFRVTGLDAPGEPNCRCTVLFEQAA